MIALTLLWRLRGKLSAEVPAGSLDPEWWELRRAKTCRSPGELASLPHGPRTFEIFPGCDPQAFDNFKAWRFSAAQPTPVIGARGESNETISFV
jgi:hypothetical protein